MGVAQWSSDTDREPSASGADHPSVSSLSQRSDGHHGTCDQHTVRCTRRPRNRAITRNHDGRRRKQKKTARILCPPSKTAPETFERVIQFHSQQRFSCSMTTFCCFCSLLPSIFVFAKACFAFLFSLPWPLAAHSVCSSTVDRHASPSSRSRASDAPGCCSMHDHQRSE